MPSGTAALLGVCPPTAGFAGAPGPVGESTGTWGTPSDGDPQAYRRGTIWAQKRIFPHTVEGPAALRPPSCPPETGDKCAWPSVTSVVAMWLRSSTGERHRGLLGAASLLWAAPQAERGSILWLLSGWPVLQPGHVVRRSQGPQTSPFPHILTRTRDSPLPRTLCDSTSIIT